jgi:hypothetical protein
MAQVLDYPHLSVSCIFMLALDVAIANNMACNSVQKDGQKKAGGLTPRLFFYLLHIPGGKWQFRTADPCSVNAVLYP